MRSQRAHPPRMLWSLPSYPCHVECGNGFSLSNSPVLLVRPNLADNATAVGHPGRFPSAGKMADWKEKILHYGKRLERNQSDEKVLDTLRKLQKVPMTISLLQETRIGRTVNHLKKNDGPVGETARAVISSWKQVVSDSTADFPEQTLPSVPAKRRKVSTPTEDEEEEEEEDEEGPSVKASRTSRPYSIEVETSSHHSRHHHQTSSHNGDRSKHHHHHHHHHQHSGHNNHSREEEAPPPKVEPSAVQKGPEKKVVDKKQMKKLLKKAGHSEGGLDGSIASFEACLGLNDTVPQPKAKKKTSSSASSPVKKPVAPVKPAATTPTPTPTTSSREHHEPSKERHRSSHATSPSGGGGAMKVVSG